jgi:hypothetical protein
MHGFMRTYLTSKFPAILIILLLWGCRKEQGFTDPVCDGDCPGFAPAYYQAATILNNPNGGVRLLIQVGSNTRTDITDGILVYGSARVKLQPGDTVFVDGRSNNINPIQVKVKGTTLAGITDTLYDYQTDQGHIVFSFNASAYYHRYDIILTDR